MKAKPEQLSADGRTLPSCKCSCGYEFDCASPPFGEKVRPQSGDITLCLKCGEIYIFTETLSVRMPTIDEIRRLDAVTWSQVERLQKVIRKARVKG
jgi:hypothetical protein